MRGVSDALLHRDPSGLMRAGAIVVGFASTVAGYLVGRSFSASVRPGDGQTASPIPRRDSKTSLQHTHPGIGVRMSRKVTRECL